MVLVVGPKAALWDYMRQECQFALQADKAVTPIQRQGDYPLVPDELKLLHFGSAGGLTPLWNFWAEPFSGRPHQRKSLRDDSKAPSSRSTPKVEVVVDFDAVGFEAVDCGDLSGRCRFFEPSG